MTEQTYHTPSLGDEEFDLPPLLSENVTSQPSSMYTNMEMPMTSSAAASSADAAVTSAGFQHQTPTQHPHHMFYRADRDGYPPAALPGRGYQPPVGPPAGMFAPHELLAAHHLRAPIYQGHVGLMGPPAASPVGRMNNSPGHTNSEDSSDGDSTSRAAAHAKSQAWMRGERPSPEPVQAEVAKPPAKKPRVARKRKKRDPNEPEKPVSAYALFFRDTQATIKGHNPNASFGEVSKIVASMWEALEVDNKNMYKKKTENAKKEYLKALAAYRASLISKNNASEAEPRAAGAGYPGGYGAGYPGAAGYPAVNGAAAPGFAAVYGRAGAGPAPGGQPSPLAKKSPLLSSLMNDARSQPQDVSGALMPPPPSAPYGAGAPPPAPPQGMLGHVTRGLMPMAGAGPYGAAVSMAQPLYMHHAQMAVDPHQRPQHPVQMASQSPPGGAGGALSSVLSPPPPLASPPALGPPSPAHQQHLHQLTPQQQLMLQQQRADGSHGNHGGHAGLSSQGSPQQGTGSPAPALAASSSPGLPPPPPHSQAQGGHEHAWADESYHHGHGHGHGHGAVLQHPHQPVCRDAYGSWGVAPSGPPGATLAPPSIPSHTPPSSN